MYQALSCFTVLQVTGSWVGAWERGYSSTCSLYIHSPALYIRMHTRAHTRTHRIVELYEECGETLSRVSAEDDLRWYSVNYGVDMPYNWPEFEVCKMLI